MLFHIARFTVCLFIPFSLSDICLLAGFIRFYQVPTRPASNVRNCSLLLTFTRPASIAMCQLFASISPVFLALEPPPARVNSQVIHSISANWTPPENVVNVINVTKKNPVTSQGNWVPSAFYRVKLLRFVTLHRLKCPRCSVTKQRNAFIMSCVTHPQLDTRNTHKVYQWFSTCKIWLPPPDNFSASAYQYQFLLRQLAEI